MRTFTVESKFGRPIEINEIMYITARAGEAIQRIEIIDVNPEGVVMKVGKCGVNMSPMYHRRFVALSTFASNYLERKIPPALAHQAAELYQEDVQITAKEVKRNRIERIRAS